MPKVYAFMSKGVCAFRSDWYFIYATATMLASPRNLVWSYVLLTRLGTGYLFNASVSELLVNDSNFRTVLVYIQSFTFSAYACYFLVLADCFRF